MTARERPSGNREPVAYFALAAFTLLGVALRLRYIDLPIRYDESFTYVAYARYPVLALLANYSTPNNHLFHTLLVHFSTAMWGIEPWAIRLPALGAGVLCIPAAYAASTVHYGRRAGLVASALVAVSAPMIAYSVNARGYTLQTLCFLLMIALAPRLTRSQSGLEVWIGFTALVAVSLLTVPTSIYSIAIVVVWMVLTIVFGKQPDKRAALLMLAAAGLLGIGIAVVFYMPAVFRSGLMALIANRFVASVSDGQFSTAIGSMLQEMAALFFANLPSAISVLLILLALVGLARRRLSLLLVAFLILPPMLLLQHVAPYARVWLFLVPLLFMTAAGGLDALFRGFSIPDVIFRSLAAAIPVVLAGLLLASTSPFWVGETQIGADAEKIVTFLRVTETNIRLYSLYPADTMLEYYARLHHVNLRASHGTRIYLVATNENDLLTLIFAAGLAHTDFPQPELIVSSENLNLYQLDLAF